MAAPQSKTMQAFADSVQAERADPGYLRIRVHDVDETLQVNVYPKSAFAGPAADAALEVLCRISRLPMHFAWRVAIRTGEHEETIELQDEPSDEDEAMTSITMTGAYVDYYPADQRADHEDAKELVISAVRRVLTAPEHPAGVPTYVTIYGFAERLVEGFDLTYRPDGTTHWSLALRRPHPAYMDHIISGLLQQIGEGLPGFTHADICRSAVSYGAGTAAGGNVDGVSFVEATDLVAQFGCHHVLGQEAADTQKILADAMRRLEEEHALVEAEKEKARGRGDPSVCVFLRVVLRVFKSADL